MVWTLAVGGVAEDQPKYDPRALEKKFIEADIKVSEKIDNAADKIDVFLTGRRLSRQRNATSVRIENSTFLKQNKDPNNETNIIAIVRLPNLEEYWQLKFSTYDEPKEHRQVTNEYVRRTPRQRNVGATIGLIRKLGNIRTAFQPRVELRNPLRVSHSLLFESLAELNHYSLNPRLEFYADSDRGVGVFQGLNYRVEFNPEWSFLMVNQGDYEEKLHRLTVTNGFMLTDAFNDKQSLSYNLFFISNNRLVYHLQNYSVSVTWSEILYKKVLDYQVTPYVEFDEYTGFQGAPGLTFDLGLNF
jgi:hypothetical protein